jgi:hypothetical protein
MQPDALRACRLRAPTVLRMRFVRRTRKISLQGGPETCSPDAVPEDPEEEGTMPRYGYDSREFRGLPDARHSYGARGYQMDAGWGWDDDGGDPNWRDGSYRGMRMQGGSHQAQYGRERLHRQADLGGYGGFDGRSDLPNGWYDRNGYYHEQYEREGLRIPPTHAAGWPRESGPHGRDGGVSYDSEYLRQYNAYSPALGPGGPRRRWR